MESKKCRVCGKEKLLAEFYYQKYCKKYRTECKKCQSEQKKTYRKNNKEKVAKYLKEYLKGYREKNMESISEWNKEYVKDNKERIARYKKEHYKINKKRLNEISKKYQEDNKEKVSQYLKEYNKKNKDKILKNKRGYDAERRKDPIIRLNQNISGGIRGSLKFKGSSKKGRHWENIVNYTSQELKGHLEKLFQPGMTWNNYGKWQVDHIIPLAFFKYTSTDDVEFKYCWSLTNLQPLWAEDNLRKRDKLNWDGS